MAIAVVALALGACASNQEARYTADDSEIDAEVGERFEIELPDDEDDGRRWRVVDDVGIIDALELDLSAMPGVEQVTRAGLGPSDRWEGGTDLEVYLSLTATPAEREAVGRTLAEHRAIAEDGLRFVSQERQYEQFLAYFADQPEYTRNVVAEDLPPSYLVTLAPGIVTLVDESADGDRRRFRFEANAPGHATIEARYANDDDNRPARTATFVVDIHR